MSEKNLDIRICVPLWKLTHMCEYFGVDGNWKQQSSYPLNPRLLCFFVVGTVITWLSQTYYSLDYVQRFQPTANIFIGTDRGECWCSWDIRSMLGHFVR